MADVDEIFLEGVWIIFDADSIPKDFARFWLAKPGKDSKQAGLSGTIGTLYLHHFPGRESETDILEQAVITFYALQGYGFKHENWEILD